MFYKRATTLSEVIPIRMQCPSSLYRDQNIQVVASKKESKIIDENSESEFDLQAEVAAHPDSLYVKCFAIKADEENDNGDYFSKEELLKSVSTFVGVPVFTNHNNTDVEKARGKVVHSWWDDEKNGIMIVARVDAVAYPKLARGIKEEYTLGCFPPDAPVLMSDGTEKSIVDIDNGDYVITHKGRARRVIGKRHRKYSYPLLSIKLDGILTPIVCTSHHNLITYQLRDKCACGCGEDLPPREDKRITASYFNRKFAQGHNPKGYKVNHDPIRKTKACDLKVGDFLFEPKIIDESEDNFVTKEEAFLIGLFIAEGSYEKREGKRYSVIFSLSSEEYETLATHCSNLLEIVFDKFRNKPTMTVHPDASQSRVSLYGIEIADWFFERCGEYSDRKQFHPKLLKLGKIKTAALLAGYMEGDGFNVKGRSYGASTVSHALASQLRLLFQKIDVRNRYRTTDDSNRWGYKLVHEISCGLTTSVLLRENLVYKKADTPTRDAAEWHSLPDITLHKIVSIEEVNYDGLVYDIEVEEDHSYCVNHVSVSNTSMGCQVKFSLCSICHNYAEDPGSYCSHIKERKTRKLTAKKQKCEYHKNGQDEKCPLCASTKDNIKTFDIDRTVFEYNYGIKFIENSFVNTPACHDCGVTEVIDPQVFLSKVADIRKRLPALLKAASENPFACNSHSCIKLAGQQELQDLNQALDLLSSVSEKMLKQKAQIDLEFLSELVEVLADLQAIIDELTQQGYGQVQSLPTEESIIPDAQPAPAPTSATGTTPVSPTPGGESKVHTGPAGSAGTVTGPLAKKTIDLAKLGFKILRKNQGLLKLSSLKLKKNLQKEISKQSPFNKKLGFKFKNIAKIKDRNKGETNTNS